MVNIFSKVLNHPNLPPGAIPAVVGVVKDAQAKFGSHEGAKRGWVVAQLMDRFHIPESLARLVLELVIRALKLGLGDELEKAG